MYIHLFPYNVTDARRTKVQRLGVRRNQRDRHDRRKQQKRGGVNTERPRTGQLAVPWLLRASAGRTRWPNPEIRCFPRRGARSARGRGARVHDLPPKIARVQLFARIHVHMQHICYYGLIAYESRATPRRSRLFMAGRPAACANGVRTHIMQMQMAHIPGAGRRTPRPTYPFWASCGGPLPRRTVAAASCSRLWPGLSAQTRPKTRRPCSSSGQSAARSTCHPSWGRTW